MSYVRTRAGTMAPAITGAVTVAEGAPFRSSPFAGFRATRRSYDGYHFERKCEFQIFTVVLKKWRALSKSLYVLTPDRSRKKKKKRHPALVQDYIYFVYTSIY